MAKKAKRPKRKRRPRWVIEVLSSKYSGHYWHMKSRNGEIVSHSQVLTTKASAVRTAREVQRSTTNSVLRILD